jgi:hypothetical protein
MKRHTYINLLIDAIKDRRVLEVAVVEYTTVSALEFANFLQSAKTVGVSDSQLHAEITKQKHILYADAEGNNALLQQRVRLLESHIYYASMLAEGQATVKVVVTKRAASRKHLSCIVAWAVAIALLASALPIAITVSYQLGVKATQPK